MTTPKVTAPKGDYDLLPPKDKWSAELKRIDAYITQLNDAMALYREDFKRWELEEAKRLSTLGDPGGSTPPPPPPPPRWP